MLNLPESLATVLEGAEVRLLVSVGQQVLLHVGDVEETFKATVPGTHHLIIGKIECSYIIAVKSCM